MVKIKKAPGDKTKFNKNRSFSGVEVKKSPKNRRKSLAAIVSTPKKQQKLKKETILDGWIVKEDIAEKTVSLSTPKNIKKKKIEITKVPDSGKKGKTPKNENTTRNKSQNVSLPETIIENKTELCVNDNVKNLEQQFDIKFANVKKAVEGVIEFHANNPKLQNQLFEERVPLFLQICCHKIPKGNPRILRIPLPNSVITADDEICLIVPEVQGIKNIEHEKHVEHYEELLRKKDVKNIKKIMTFHELRTEYETFEQKSRLVDLYDIFLVDGRICGKVTGKCGKIFYKKRKVPAPVKLQASKLKEHIDKVLSKVFCHLHLKGDNFSVQFGHNKMEIDDLVTNIFSIIEMLNKEFPGGFKNIKGLNVLIKRAPSIPIYVSFTNPKDIETLKMNSKKPKAYVSHKDELSTLPNAEVTVRPSGRVLVTRVKQGKVETDNVITDADIIKANKDIEKVHDENQKKGKKMKRKQSEVAEVVKKKRKTEINLKAGKQRIAGTPESGKARDSEVAKKKMNVVSMPKRTEASHSKVTKKKKKINVGVSKKTMNDSSGDNLVKNPKKVKMNKNVKTKKNKFTM